MQDSIHESESSDTQDIQNSQGVAENTTETEVESAVTPTPARCKRLKKSRRGYTTKEGHFMHGKGSFYSTF